MGSQHGERTVRPHLVLDAHAVEHADPGGVLALAGELGKVVFGEKHGRHRGVRIGMETAIIVDNRA